MKQSLDAHFKISDKVCYFQGCFDKFTIPNLWKKLQPALQATPANVVNLSEVEECDSALIALLVEIKKQQYDLNITAIPENLEQLLDLYQVKTLLS
ncbi:STAS domain-containing protein [Ignatzschineria larvae DSM 13226]|uniref:STAS domain-containing protein n=1 Tax=Ignatzschineria larvae DSM 13226 TaxID=1111732 RepID=A0ABZ3BWT9_9GAMM|nr:STAS domain-containing protein [Ignatzschineria larvae]